MANMGMQVIRAATVIGAALTLTIAQSAVARDASARVQLATGSSLTLRGKSTMHDYASKATRLQLEVELADTLAPGPLTLAQLAEKGAVKSIVLTVPVAGLKSEKDGLDKNMYKALKATANPNIVFRIVTATPGSNAVFRVAGELEVAGVRRPLEVDVRASETSEGIVLEGTQTLSMPDYGIKPPSMFLGTLKTDPKVVIDWRLVLTSHVQAAGF
jgi:hypothetical protein